MGATMKRALWLLPVLVLGSPSLGRASEGQWHLGGGPAVQRFTGGETAPALQGVGAYEWSDSFDLRLELLGAAPRLEPGALQASVAVGAAYKLDVIEWVPYFGLLLGYYELGSARPAPLAARELGLSIPLGLDYALSRQLVLGLQLRYHAFLSELPQTLGEASLLSAGLRLEGRWGW